MPHDQPATDSELIDVQTFSGQFTDAFDKLIVTSNTVQLDLPSTYRATPERFKCFVNGTRTDIPNVSQLTDTEISYEFAIGAGETVRWQSRERPRYVPNYDSVWSAALRFVDSLEAGDYVRVGQAAEELDTDAGTGTGWYWELSDGDPRYVIYARGQEVASVAYPDFPVDDFANPVRLAAQYNLYNVGPQQPSVYYTDSDGYPDDPGRYHQMQPVSVDGNWAVGEFNTPVFMEFSVGAGNATKTFEAGTISYAVLGDVEETARSKWARDRDISAGGSFSINASDYSPFLAIRHTASDDDVNVNFESFVLNADTDGEVVVKSFYPDQVGFLNGSPQWSTPPQQTPTNTAVQVSERVTEIEDQSGNSVSQTSTPGGFQVGFVSDSGTGNNNKGDVSPTALNTKRPLHQDAIAVALKRNDPGLGAGAGGEFAFETSQTF